MFVVLRLIWPYLLRYVMNQGAERTANYLQARRERWSQRTTDPQEIETVLEHYEETGELPLDEICPPAPEPTFFAVEAFWFTLSGIFLGAALSIIVTILKRED